jgi:hypothetical protein
MVGLEGADFGGKSAWMVTKSNCETVDIGLWVEMPGAPSLARSCLCAKGEKSRTSTALKGHGRRHKIHQVRIVETKENAHWHAERS